MPTVPINYWAILVCGIASMVIGSLWYGPLFGKMFIQLSGWDKKTPAELETAKKSMSTSYVLAFIGALVMAYVLAHSIFFAQTYLKISDSSAAIQGALWNWLGFMVPVLMGSVLWEAKPWKLWTLNVSYYLVQLLVFAFILVSWKA